MVGYTFRVYSQSNKESDLVLQGLRYQEIAFKITKLFMGNAFEDDELHEIIEKAYDFSHICALRLLSWKPITFY